MPKKLQNNEIRPVACRVACRDFLLTRLAVIKITTCTSARETRQYVGYPSACHVTPGYGERERDREREREIDR